MKAHIRRADLAFIIINSIVLGGCFVLLVLRGPNGPLVLLTVGTAGMLLGKTMKAWRRGHEAPASELMGRER